MRREAFSFFLAALVVLMLPLKWWLSAAAAAIFHEVCHLLVLFLMREKVSSVHVTFRGCTIVTGNMPEWKQAVSILAGPAGSLSLLFLRRKLPLIAMCGLFHGVYNFLPVLPLDGGRLFCLLLYRICPRYADTVLKVTKIIVRILLFMSLVYILFLGM